ncbi:MAG: hypothetical protein ABI647_12005 [Gemmatimonadota bacterium]
MNSKAVSKSRLRVWLLVALAVLVALLVIARLTLAHYTSASYLERRLSAALAAASDSLYQITIGSTHTSLLADRFVVTDLVIKADTLVSERKRKAGTLSRTGYATSIPSLELTGIDRWAMLRGRVSIGSLRIDHPRIDVSLDRHIAAVDPNAPAELPPQALRDLDRDITIGSTRLENGQIHYAEQAIDGVRAGRLHFDDVNLTMSAINNRLPAGATTAPVAIELSALVAGKAKLQATFDYDFAAPELTVSYRGGIGAMDAKAFNSMLVDLEGTEVSGGRLDSAAFDLKVVNDVASGKVETLYHDVNLKLLSKRSHDQSLGDVLKTVLSNTVTNSDNPEKGKPPRVSSIHVRRDTGTPLIKFLWITLRQGLAETLGLQPAASPADKKAAEEKKKSAEKAQAAAEKKTAEKEKEKEKEDKKKAEKKKEDAKKAEKKKEDAKKAEKKRAEERKKDDKKKAEAAEKKSAAAKPPGSQGP